jgi:hypothetical protein
LPKNELLDIFYNGLTVESKTYLDSCAGCVFRKRTPAEAEELMAKISRNYDDWTMAESVMSTHASVLVDSVGPPSAKVCRAAASFP